MASCPDLGRWVQIEVLSLQSIKDLEVMEIMETTSTDYRLPLVDYMTRGRTADDPFKVNFF